MQIRPVGAELSHADRRTNMTKLTVAFRNFANGPKTVPSYGEWTPVCVYSVTRQRQASVQHSALAMSSNRTDTFPTAQSF
jgi:hypothetical protein